MVGLGTGRHPTCPSVRASFSKRSPQAHLTHVSTLSGPGISPYPASYPRPLAEVPASGPGFLSPFGHRHWLVGSSFARWDTPPSSRTTHRTTARTPNGIVTFHTIKIRPGRVPPIPRGRRCHLTGTGLPVSVGRFPAACPTPAPVPIGGSPMTRHQQGFTRVHPSGLPLHLWLPDGPGTLGLDNLSFAPRSHPQRTSGRG